MFIIHIIFLDTIIAHALKTGSNRTSSRFDSMRNEIIIIINEEKCEKENPGKEKKMKKKKHN